jgi:hypothetical protein
MPLQELALPALVKRNPKSPHLQILICEICMTEAEFDPLEPGQFEHALHQIQHHRCKNQ